MLILSPGMPLSGVGNGDVEVQPGGDLGDDGAHDLIVHGVGDLQVLVLCGVEIAVLHGFIKALLGEIIGDDNGAGVVGVAPFALVVILVVGGSHMPALIQGGGVVLVGGVVPPPAPI